jgi:hypothetical protein
MLALLSSDGVKGLQHVINDVFKQAMVKVKKQCEGASQAFCGRTLVVFHTKHEIITRSLGVVYHNYKLEI